MSIRDLATKGENDMFKMLEFVVESYPVTYKTLLESKPIKCEETGTTFDAVAPPSLVVADVNLSVQRDFLEILTNYYT